MKKFPDNFLWGTAEDAYQHEGGNYNNDWYRWESSEPSPVVNGDRLGTGPDFYNRYEEDFTAAAENGESIHRMGVEWSRIEPEPGYFDESVLNHYAEMLRFLKKKNFLVILNIWHFTLPLWVAEKGGFENDDVLKVHWPVFVAKCAESFSEYVDYWSVAIDSQIYALRGYAAGDIPPGIKSVPRAFKMYSRMTEMHKIAFRTVKEKAGNNAKVGQIYFFFCNQPASRKTGDLLAYRIFDSVFNWNMLKKLYRSKTLDWLGINYYTRQLISLDFNVPGFISQKSGTEFTKTDMGWEIYPEGLQVIFRKLSSLFPDLPLHITECGLADESDNLRSSFIIRHLEKVHELIAEGVDIRSFSYWSSIDNWEWTEGWGPKFGLYSWDPETLERKARPSAALYREIVRRNALHEADNI